MEGALLGLRPLVSLRTAPRAGGGGSGEDRVLHASAAMTTRRQLVTVLTSSGQVLLSVRERASALDAWEERRTALIRVKELRRESGAAGGMPLVLPHPGARVVALLLGQEVHLLDAVALTTPARSRRADEPAAAGDGLTVDAAAYRSPVKALLRRSGLLQARDRSERTRGAARDLVTSVAAAQRLDAAEVVRSAVQRSVAEFPFRGALASSSLSSPRVGARLAPLRTPPSDAEGGGVSSATPTPQWRVAAQRAREKRQEEQAAARNPAVAELDRLLVGQGGAGGPGGPRNAIGVREYQLVGGVAHVHLEQQRMLSLASAQVSCACWWLPSPSHAVADPPEAVLVLGWTNGVVTLMDCSRACLSESPLAQRRDAAIGDRLTSTTIAKTQRVFPMCRDQRPITALQVCDARTAPPRADAAAAATAATAAPAAVAHGPVYLHVASASMQSTFRLEWEFRARSARLGGALQRVLLLESDALQAAQFADEDAAAQAESAALEGALSGSAAATAAAAAAAAAAAVGPSAAAVATSSAASDASAPSASASASDAAAAAAEGGSKTMAISAGRKQHMNRSYWLAATRRKLARGRLVSDPLRLGQALLVRVEQASATSTALAEAGVVAQVAAEAAVPPVHASAAPSSSNTLWTLPVPRAAGPTQDCLGPLGCAEALDRPVPGHSHDAWLREFAGYGDEDEDEEDAGGAGGGKGGEDAAVGEDELQDDAESLRASLALRLRMAQARQQARAQLDSSLAGRSLQLVSNTVVVPQLPLPLPSASASAGAAATDSNELIVVSSPTGLSFDASVVPLGATVLVRGVSGPRALLSSRAGPAAAAAVEQSAQQQLLQQSGRSFVMVLPASRRRLESSRALRAAEMVAWGQGLGLPDAAARNAAPASSVRERLLESSLRGGRASQPSPLAAAAAEGGFSASSSARQRSGSGSTVGSAGEELLAAQQKRRTSSRLDELGGDDEALGGSGAGDDASSVGGETARSATLFHRSQGRIPMEVAWLGVGGPAALLAPPPSSAAAGGSASGATLAQMLADMPDAWIAAVSLPRGETLRGVGACVLSGLAEARAALRPAGASSSSSSSSSSVLLPSGSAVHLPETSVGAVSGGVLTGGEARVAGSAVLLWTERGVYELVAGCAFEARAVGRRVARRVLHVAWQQSSEAAASSGSWSAPSPRGLALQTCHAACAAASALGLGARSTCEAAARELLRAAVDPRTAAPAHWLGVDGLVANGGVLALLATAHCSSPSAEDIVQAALRVTALAARCGCFQLAALVAEAVVVAITGQSVPLARASAASPDAPDGGSAGGRGRGAADAALHATRQALLQWARAFPRVVARLRRPTSREVGRSKAAAAGTPTSPAPRRAAAGGGRSAGSGTPGVSVAGGSSSSTALVPAWLTRAAVLVAVHAALAASRRGRSMTIALDGATPPLQRWTLLLPPPPAMHVVVGLQALQRWMRTTMPLMVGGGGASGGGGGLATANGTSPGLATPERRSTNSAASHLMPAHHMSPALRAAAGNVTVAASANAMLHSDVFRWAALLGVSDVLQYPEAYRRPLRDAIAHDLAIAQTIGGAVLSNPKLRTLEDQLLDVGVAPPSVHARRLVHALLRATLDHIRPYLHAASDPLEDAAAPPSHAARAPFSSEEFEHTVRDFLLALRRLDHSKLLHLIAAERAPPPLHPLALASSSTTSSTASSPFPSPSSASSSAAPPLAASATAWAMFGNGTSAAAAAGRLALPHALPSAAVAAPLAGRAAAALSRRERRTLVARTAALLWVSALAVQLLLPAFRADPWCAAARILAAVHTAHRATGARAPQAEALLPHLVAAIATQARLAAPLAAAALARQLEAWAAGASSVGASVAALDAAVATHPAF